MKNSKGFTLVEIIVAMAVGAIFVTCVIALVAPSTKIFNRVEDSSDARLLTESVLEDIRHDANYANTLTAGDKDPQGNGTININGKSIIYVDKDGYLAKRAVDEEEDQGERLFDAKFYKNKTVEMDTVQVGKATENCIDMTLRVFSGDRQLYELTSQLKPVLTARKTATEDPTQPTTPPSPTIPTEVINNATNWPESKQDKVKFDRGDIIVYNQKYYVTLQDNTNVMGQIDQGPTGHKFFAEITGKVLTSQDLNNGRLYGVNVGDLYRDKEGALYICAIYQEHKLDDWLDPPPSDKKGPWVKIQIQ